MASFVFTFCSKGRHSACLGRSRDRVHTCICKCHGASPAPAAPVARTETYTYALCRLGRHDQCKMVWRGALPCACSCHDKKEEDVPSADHIGSVEPGIDVAYLLDSDSEGPTPMKERIKVPISPGIVLAVVETERTNPAERFLVIETWEGNPIPIIHFKTNLFGLACERMNAIWPS